MRIGLHGERREIDTGTVNGERFAVMAGAGFDALMISDASRRMKARLGRFSYLYTGARNLSVRGTKAVIKVDGSSFFSGRVSCVLVGNVGRLFGGIEVFSRARPDDGRLDVGVVTAQNPGEWARTLARVAAGSPRKSPSIRVTQGCRITVRFNRACPYELDGGARTAVTKLQFKVRPASIRICVPGGAGTSR